MEQLEAARFQFLRSSFHSFGALDVEFDADLRNRCVGRPVFGAETCLRGLGERPDAKCLTPSMLSL
jgi:hypothetical protein